ncbi:hypothetical protein [Dyadobacter sp. CY323]|uniref:hypothetical protein n=1 Tax=Dyadobacter sp. CY323 TaxID=2907302 RepID=UPI001F1FFD0D|nr:hypothetical protein [Dyadobacter sp. CY323]MCE6990460.1 hypothetical protein [Dyadobacter sp. CY323]
MKKSNIFAYIELTKLVDELKSSSEAGKLKQKLKSQSAYFNIIEPRYFSEGLVGEWESILSVIKQKGAKTNEEGKVVSNAVSNTIDQLSDKECEVLVDKIRVVYDQVRKEFQ